ncbi:MAG: hypothetical protein AB1540_17425 [Bdellovibrionota bacterium]
MKIQSFRLLPLFLVLTAIFGTGCPTKSTGPRTAPQPVCNDGLLEIDNFAEEWVDVMISGPDAYNEVLADGEGASYPLFPGTYRISAVGRTTGHEFANYEKFYGCNSYERLAFLPAPRPLSAELDVENDTGEAIQVWIDGVYIETLFADEVGIFTNLEANISHDIRIVQDSTLTTLWEEPIFMAENVVTVITVEREDLPIADVEIHNQMPDIFSGGECVNAFWDQAAVEFDSGHFDVCPAETGYFSVYAGRHLLEVFGVDSLFTYYTSETSQGITELFEPNSTTVVEITP